MIHKTMFCQLLILGSRFTIVGIRIDADATTWCEITRNFDIFRIHQLDKIFHNDVHTIFMEITMIAETKQVEF